MFMCFQEIECYLLDENGFVLFSEIPEEVSNQMAVHSVK